jgi:hypothetical protein
MKIPQQPYRCPLARLQPNAVDAEAVKRDGWREQPDGSPLVGVQIPHRSTKRYTVRAWPTEKVVALVRALGFLAPLTTASVDDGARFVRVG